MNGKTLASQLEGKKVGQWNVIKRKPKDANDSSGYFSSCYFVENDKGERAFLKAYNYLYAFGKKAGAADTLKMMTENFTYERDLLKLCGDNKMRRVVMAIGSGEYAEAGEVITVPYLVFEHAARAVRASGHTRMSSSSDQKVPSSKTRSLCSMRSNSASSIAATPGRKSMTRSPQRTDSPTTASFGRQRASRSALT